MSCGKCLCRCEEWEQTALVLHLLFVVPGKLGVYNQKEDYSVRLTPGSGEQPAIVPPFCAGKPRTDLVCGSWVLKQPDPKDGNVRTLLSSSRVHTCLHERRDYVYAC